MIFIFKVQIMKLVRLSLLRVNCRQVSTIISKKSGLIVFKISYSRSLEVALNDLFCHKSAEMEPFRKLFSKDLQYLQ